jgi:hypothetical protein
MRLTPLLLLLANILMVGCARQSVDCTMGAGHNGCAPGTKEYEQYEQMVQQHQDAKTADEMDDTLCRSYGAQPGTAGYTECRRKRAGDRQMFEPPRSPQSGQPKRGL